MTTLVHRGLAPVKEVFPNGVTVVAKDSHATPAVTISAAVRAGNVCDPPDLIGLAHFVSRVLDRGTRNLTADAIAEDLDGRGVSLHTSVNRHLMTLVTTCLVEDFEAVLTLVGDILMHPSFPQTEVQTRRAEIVTAIRQDQDNPAVAATEALMHVLYDGHPYGRRGKGTLASVAQIDREALVRFHRERFAPGNLSLVLVGDLEPGRAVEAASRVLGNWTAERTPEPKLDAVMRTTERRQVVLPMMNKAQVDIAYGLTTLTRSDPAFYALWVMNTMLGQYALGGRLGESIREDRGMAYYVFSTLDASVVEGPLMIRAGVSPENVDRTVAAIDAEVQRMAELGLTPTELADAKRYMIGSLPRMLETNPSIATFLQTSEYFGLGLDYDLRLPSLLEAVTLEDVQAIAGRLLAPERAALAIAGPYDNRDDSASSA